MADYFRPLRKAGTPLPDYSDPSVMDPDRPTEQGRSLLELMNILGGLPVAELKAAGLAGAGLLGATKSVGQSLEKTMADIAKREVAVPKAGRGKKLIDNSYVGTGAFGGVSPQKLGQMRKDYLAKMRDGVGGRLWYDESSDDIFRWTGESASEADKMANALAITSSRTPVASNLMYANKGWNQSLVGDPVRTGGFPTNMGKQIEEAFISPEASATGLKRSPFSAGLSVKWRGADFANRPTHDIHDVRAWGIKDPKTGEDWSKGVGEAGHRFLDEQGAWVTDQANLLGLGGVSDWTPYRSQAAAWIAQKAKKEGKPISDTARHYGSYAPEYQALIPREFEFGDNTGILQSLRNAPQDVRQSFADEMEAILRGTQGQDNLGRKMGALTDTSIPNEGVYEGVRTPSYISRVNVGKASGDVSEFAMDDASDRVVRSVASAHGLLLPQKQVAYNYASSRASDGSALVPKDLKQMADVFQIQMGRTPSLDELRVISKRMQDAGVDVPMADATGARGLVFHDFDNQGAEQLISRQKGLKQAMDSIAADFGGNVRTLRRSGDILPYEPPQNWSTKPFIEGIEQGGPKMVEGFNQAASEFAPKIKEVVSKYANQLGDSVPQWYPTALDALQTGGLSALKDLVAKGIVPVTAFAALGLSSGGEGSYD